MFGDIVKVTPSSKVVGDMALFMTANDYTEQDIFEKGETISFPDSVIGLFRGDLGQTPGGFPETLQKIILKNEKPLYRPAQCAFKPMDLEKEMATFQTKYGKQYDPASICYLTFFTQSI